MAEPTRPIACDLPARESRNQIGEWHALGEFRVTAERIEGGYAVTFDAAVADAVTDLARRESTCCGFLDITTTPVDDGIRLSMTSEDPDALPVVELLVGQGP